MTPPAAAIPRRGWLPPALAVIAALYALAVAASLLWQATRAQPAPFRPPDDHAPGFVALPALTAAIPDNRPPEAAEPVHLHALAWPGSNPDPADAPRNSPAPLILLHGSPGAATNFSEMAPRLIAGGRDVYALDLPGFGRSTPNPPDLSIRAHARYVLAWMDAKAIDRAHALGWSMGGGVALEMARLLEEQAPGRSVERLASITLLGAIGAQETEGSGSYAFEHAKYALGALLLGPGLDLIPHFGLFGRAADRTAFIKNFADTDQRPLAGVMRALRVPVLIHHGRHDFLVSDWAAEHHRALIPTAHLVMTGHDHFVPFTRPSETAADVGRFIASHDAPGVPPRTEDDIRAPAPTYRGLAAPVGWLVLGARMQPWWLVVVVAALVARWKPETATALAGLLVASLSVDFAVAALGLLIGRFWRGRSAYVLAGGPLGRTVGWAVATALWGLVSLGLAQALSPSRGALASGGLPLLLAWLAAVTLGLWVLRLGPTRLGRVRMGVAVRRQLHHEWWPTWRLYAPLLPTFIRLSLRHRSCMVWTCCNPGIANGGGAVSDIKADILDALRTAPAELLLPHAVVRANADRRARTAEALRTLEQRPDLGGLPVIVKPDTGERGAGVSLVRTPEDFDAAFARLRADAVLQRYHPGPHEIGVFWVRSPEWVAADPPPGTLAGRVVNVVVKEPPLLLGDGRRTVRELLLRHPRYRLQLPMYLSRLRAHLRRVPALGEAVRLGVAGNHAQGCLFTDGAHLVTPELEAAVDSVARSFAGVDGLPFDTGRFDLRYTSPGELARGRGFGVVELNGVTSEPTNMYDPSWPVSRAVRTMAVQWERQFDLGARRRAMGVRPLPLWRLVWLFLRSQGRPRPIAA